MNGTLERVLYCPSLTKISLALDRDGLTSDILTMLSAACLTTLNVCTRSLFGKLWSTDKPYAPDYQHKCYDLVAPYVRSLQTLRVNTAWEACYWLEREFDGSTCYSFCPQELILGTRMPNSYGRFWSCDGCFTLWHCIYGHPNARARYRPKRLPSWGHDLRRLRIDHIEMSDLKDLDAWVDASNWPDSLAFGRLRVLMLRPGHRSTRSSLLYDADERDLWHRGTYIPPIGTIKPEAEVLRRIDVDSGEILAVRLLPRLVEAGFRRLRVLVIGDAHVWVEWRPEGNGESRRPVAWKLATAMRDAEQGPLVEQYVSRRYLACLEDDSSVPRMEQRAIYPSWMLGATEDPAIQLSDAEAAWNIVGVTPLTRHHSQPDREERADDEELGWVREDERAHCNEVESAADDKLCLSSL